MYFNYIYEFQFEAWLELVNKSVYLFFNSLWIDNRCSHRPIGIMMPVGGGGAQFSMYNCGYWNSYTRLHTLKMVAIVWPKVKLFQKAS